MALLYSTQSDNGTPAHPFSLPGVDGMTYTLETFKDKKGLLLIFMCNHCPYVIAVHERLSALAREFGPKGIAIIGINSNDPLYREADSFSNMVKIAEEWKLAFPYVFDETQAVAQSYGAVCTPDPYLYENTKEGFKLCYRGRIDDSWKDPSKVTEENLREAMERVLAAKPPLEIQPPSMGCSIKWKKN